MTFDPTTKGPNRCTTLPTGPKERKKYPIFSGVLAYFPDAIAAVARVSWEGNNQHNPGEPLHWARGKSMDQEDTLVRHLMESGGGNVGTGYDADGQLHSAKAAWRALAKLQLEIEQERAAVATPEPVDVMERRCVNCGKRYEHHYGERCHVESTASVFKEDV